MNTRYLADECVQSIGSTLTAYVTNTDGRDVTDDWVLGHIEPTPEQALALHTAATVFRDVADAESRATARAWFIGLNPFLSSSPAEAIRAGRHLEVHAAATNLIEDAGGGW